MGNYTFCCCTTDPMGTVIEQAQLQPHVDRARTQEVSEQEAELLETKHRSQAVPALAPARSEVGSLPDERKGDFNMATAGSSSPETTTCVFTIKLTRKDSSEKWGLGLKRSNVTDTLLIMNPAGRALEAWEEANPNMKIKKWDAIISVNGESGSKRFDMLKSAMELNMTICRLLRIPVEIDSKSGSLGMKILPDTLTVGSLTDGMIMDYNRNCTPTHAIIEGDQIVSINGTTVFTSKDLLRELALVPEGAPLKLLFSRSAIS